MIARQLGASSEEPAGEKTSFRFRVALRSGDKSSATGRRRRSLERLHRLLSPLCALRLSRALTKPANKDESSRAAGEGMRTYIISSARQERRPEAPEPEAARADSPNIPVRDRGMGVGTIEQTAREPLCRGLIYRGMGSIPSDRFYSPRRWRFAAQFPRSNAHCSSLIDGPSASENATAAIRARQDPRSLRLLRPPLRPPPRHPPPLVRCYTGLSSSYLEEIIFNFAADCTML